MHPELALVAELSGFLGDIPSLESYFLEQNTNLKFGSTVAPSVTCTIRKMMYAHDMLMTTHKKDQVEYNFPSRCKDRLNSSLRGLSL